VVNSLTRHVTSQTLPALRKRQNVETDYFSCSSLELASRRKKIARRILDIDRKLPNRLLEEKRVVTGAAEAGNFTRLRRSNNPTVPAYLKC